MPQFIGIIILMLIFYSILLNLLFWISTIRKKMKIKKLDTKPIKELLYLFSGNLLNCPVAKIIKAFKRANVDLETLLATAQREYELEMRDRTKRSNQKIANQNDKINQQCL